MEEKLLVDQPRYICCYCDRNFIFEEVMNMHKYAMHSKLTEITSNMQHFKIDKSKVCPHCGKTFRGGSVLRYHIKSVHTGEVHFCSLCSFSTRRIDTLKKHNDARHLKLTRVKFKDMPYSKTDKFKVCPHCGKTLRGGDSFGNHLKNIHTGTIRACSLCPFGTRNIATLKLHIRAKHQGLPRTRRTSVSKKKEKLVCPSTNCNATRRNSQNLEKHKIDAHSDMKVTCPHCGKTLGETSLSSHIKHLHTGEIHLCSKCSFSTKNNSTLKAHFKRLHTSWKESCQFCGKIVKGLKSHLRATMCGKEVDDRNKVPCPKCPRILRSKSKLIQHTSHIHDGIKDKYCTQCSYKTYSSHNLRLHVSNVHEKTPIVYNSCPHCHIKTGNIEKHLQIYHIED